MPGFGPTQGRRRRRHGSGTPAPSPAPSPTPTPAPTLAALSLALPTIAENTTAGSVVSAIAGRTAGSTLALANDAGGRFAISGAALIAGLVTTNFEGATSHSITLRETLAGATNSPRDTVLAVAVTDVAEAVAVPSGFPYTPGFTILRTGSGAPSTFTTTLDMAALKLAFGHTVYVDPAGHNDNDGTSPATPGTPGVGAVRSFKLAKRMLNLAIGSTGGGRIVFKSSTGAPVLYRHSNTQSRTVTTGGLNAGYRDCWNAFANDVEPNFPNLVVEPKVPGGEAISIIDFPFTSGTWTVFSGNIWQRTYTTEAFDANLQICDFANLDRNGVPRRLENVTTTAGSQAAAINAAWTARNGWEDYPSGDPKYTAPYGLGRAGSIRR